MRMLIIAGLIGGVMTVVCHSQDYHLTPDGDGGYYMEQERAGPASVISNACMATTPTDGWPNREKNGGAPPGLAELPIRSSRSS